MILKITLTDKSQFELTLDQSPFCDFLLRTYKHLQHIDVPKTAKSELYLDKHQQDQYKQLWQSSIAELVKLGQELANIDIDREQLTNQKYLNYLHQHYENNYKQTTYNRTWLKFHDLIHLIELFNKPSDEMINILCYYLIDYEDLDGKLQQSISDRTIIENSVTDFKEGHCYLIWQELGKTPMQYWRDGYSGKDIDHFLAVARPLTYIKPTLCIGLTDFEYKINQKEIDQFDKWFEPLKPLWMEHYNIDKLYDNEIYSLNHLFQGPRFKIGELDNFKEFNQKLKNGITPIRVTL